jgi:hypothetical protein
MSDALASEQIVAAPMLIRSVRAASSGIALNAVIATSERRSDRVAARRFINEHPRL